MNDPRKILVYTRKDEFDVETSNYTSYATVFYEDQKQEALDFCLSQGEVFEHIVYSSCDVYLKLK